MMSLPERLTIHNSAFALDGGTTVLRATDETGRERGVMLVQHAFPQSSPTLGKVPGRLYFDGELVPMRSELESGVLALLREAEVRYVDPLTDRDEQDQLAPNALILGEDIRQVISRGPDENMRAQVAAIVRFVESEEYFCFADRVEQAADPTQYTVWPAWEPATRNQVVVRLGRVLGVGVQAARELLDAGLPLASGVSAMEVSELAGRYSAEGVSLRVEPPFRWQLA